MDTPATPFLDNRLSMRIAQAAQWLRGIVVLILLASYGMQHYLLQQAQLGMAISAAEADANDSRVQILSGIQFAITVLAYIALIQWFFRAYRNVHRLPRSQPEYGENMAAWSWFIPFLNLWYPYKILLEIGHYLGRFSHPRTTVLSSKWDYLAVSWEILYIATFIISRVNFTLTHAHDSTLAELVRTTRLLMGSQAITLLSTAITLALLKTISPHERALLTSKALSEPPASFPDGSLQTQVTE